MGWIVNAASMLAFVAQPDFAAGETWLDANPDPWTGNGYACSKEAINTYVAWRGFQLAPQGIRLNSLNPGPTDTPMMPAFIESQGQEFFDNFPKPIGRNSTAEEQAWCLVMLNSPRSSYVVATSVFADGGFTEDHPTPLQLEDRVLDLGTDGDRQVGGERPWGGRPDPDLAGLLAVLGLELETHRDRRVLAIAVGVVESRLEVRDR